MQRGPAPSVREAGSEPSRRETIMRSSVEYRPRRRVPHAPVVGSALAVASTLLLLLPFPAATQEPEEATREPEEGVQLHAGASAGMFWTGRGRLYSWTSASGTAGVSEVGHAALQPGVVGGLQLRARVPAWRLDVGVSVDRTFGTDGVLTTETVCTGICLSILRPIERHPFDADLTLISGHVDLRPFPRPWRFQPFLSAGYGMEVYDLATGSVPDTVSAPLPEDTHAGVYRLGAGVSFPARNVTIVVRMNSFLGGYERPGGGGANWQEQLTATMGLLYRIR